MTKTSSLAAGPQWSSLRPHSCFPMAAKDMRASALVLLRLHLHHIVLLEQPSQPNTVTQNRLMIESRQHLA